MAEPYQPTAGPSRHYDQHIPLPIPMPSTSASPTLSPGYTSHADSGNPPWAGEHGNAPNPTADHAERNVEGTKRNPLVDLIDTERIYVEQLGLVIRRVAAAWSRKDFPPPKLDAMFRCVETVYRANRSFGARLKDIGPNPSSPKALGDLLMRWIDDLEPAYQKYAETFMTGFDSYAAVAHNTLLPGILADISGLSPPPPPLQSWSLDALFILPYTRLRYYRKLYARLLRSTKEGRSDHKLLVVANQRLDTLVSDTESRLEVDVSEEESTAYADSRPPSGAERSREPSWPQNERPSRTSSAAGSSLDSHSNFSPFSSRVDDFRTSGGSVATSVTQSPQRRPTITVPKMTAVTPTVSAPNSATSPLSDLSDLEFRIDPERTVDLFTMQLKCKLQMNPPNLPFPRYLRSSHDVTVYFTPNSTGQQVVHQRAHVFILSDLFLVAEWMEATDKAAKAQEVAREQPQRVGQGGPMPEMWLSYPPLAGKHLVVAEGGQANVLTVTIMRKETFVVHAESELARDQIMKDLLDCIDFASTSSRPPAMPMPLHNELRSPASQSDHRSLDTFPPLRHPSPFSPESSPSVSPRPGDVPQMPPPPMAGNALASQMNKFSLEPGETIAWNRGLSPVQSQPSVQLPSGPSVGVLPPRQASLRSRVPSGPPSMPPPSMPQMPSGNNSDPNLGSYLHQHHQGAQLPRSSSGRSVQSAPRTIEYNLPPLPVKRGPGSPYSEGPPPMFNGHHPPSRSRSAEPLRVIPPEPPSARFSNFPSLPGNAAAIARADEDSPPASPVEEEAATLTGPAVISAQMKCKVFLKQSHQQWKALGSGKLKLYAQAQGNVKQLVVESESSSKALLISTIVLTDGVERVAKTGVAVEISDRGKRTGIIYMIQLRNENSAAGLFESLLAGSDRAIGGR